MSCRTMGGTAESANDDALGRIVEECQAKLDSKKIATAIIKSTLTDAKLPRNPVYRPLALTTLDAVALLRHPPLVPQLRMHSS